jgi:hypothetical protein
MALRGAGDAIANAALSTIGPYAAVKSLVEVANVIGGADSSTEIKNEILDYLGECVDPSIRTLEGDYASGQLVGHAVVTAAVTAGLGAATVSASGGSRAGRLLWGAWDDYAKVTVGGREYAQIGERLYTRHAVERMMPRGLTTEGRSISPNFVEDVLRRGSSKRVVVHGVERQIFRSGSVEVVTEQEGRLVVTVNPFMD